RFLHGYDKVLAEVTPKNPQLILQERGLGNVEMCQSSASSDSGIVDFRLDDDLGKDSEKPAACYNDVFRRKWEYYFAYCEGAFATRTIGCTQLVFTQLLESLELRFALANSDDSLQKLVTTLLVPLLEKLDTAGGPVRAKVIALLGQINKKLRGHPQVTIPTDALFQSTFGGSSSSAYSQSFKLMYVTTAVERAPTKDLLDKLPLLLAGMDSWQGAPKKIVTSALMTVVQRSTDISDESLRRLDFSQSADQAKALLAVAADLFLFTPASGDGLAAGLSPQAQSTLTNDGKAAWVGDREQMRQLKMNFLRIVGSELAFPSVCAQEVHEMRFLALTCAGCDAYFPDVVTRSDDALKRLRPLDTESGSLVSAMLSVFLGSVPETAADVRRTPVSAPIRLKVLTILCRSTKAAATFPDWIRVVFESLFGAGTTSRLRRQGVAFMQWVIRMAPQAQVDRSVPILMQGIRKILNEEATASLNARLDDDIIRGLAYVSWGSLGKRVPKSFSGDLSHLKTMFEAFDRESPNVRLSIQEALLAMLPAYDSSGTSGQMQSELILFLAAQLNNEVRQARYCALRYAIAAFPFANVSARWICLLALADSEREVRALAKSGLAIPPGMLARDQNLLPDTTGAITFIYERISEVTRLPAESAASRQGAAHPSVYGGLIEFGRSLLLAKGMAQLKAEDPAVVLDVLDTEAVNDGGELATELQRNSMSRALAGLAGSSSSSPGLASWTGVLSFALTSQHLLEAGVLPRSLVCLVELLSLGPPDAALAFFDQRQVFLGLLSSREQTTQQYAAQLLAAIYAARLFATDSGHTLDCEFWNTDVARQLEELLSVLKEPAHPNLLDKKRGAILALGYIGNGLCAARLALRKTWADLGISNVGSILDTAYDAVLHETQAASKTTGTHAMITGALCVAIGELSKTGDARAPAAMDAVADIGKQSTKDGKVQDAAYRALANIALGDVAQGTRLISFLQQSAAAVNKKQLDAHFRIGEALAMALGRFQCSLVRLHWILPFAPEQVYGEDKLSANAEGIDLLFELATGKMVRSPSPQDRQAVAVWTLSLVQFCPNLPQLKPWLSRLHTCLCSLLTDRDEFTQEAASKTLGLVYDMGDAGLKEDLVYSLMALFGGSGKKAGSANAHTALQQQIQADQPLLEEQTLGQTPDGHAVNTTYSSILSLASDMQNPALVYQFMQLASHTAVWNSRRGAAYGFASVIERARESMKPHMALIIPKLYRYTFDPSPQTRTAMTSIWRALLGPGSEDANMEDGSSRARNGVSVIEQSWGPIIEECLASMGQREWRVRESGCAALAGTLPGADPELVVPYLERIWRMAFRSLDDIKGSVREAGLKTCQALANATVTWCTPRVPRESERDRRAHAVLEIVVPFLVDKGVMSDAEDVRTFSLMLLLKLCKSSGYYLTCFAAHIAERLLESLSNMEPQSANYLTFHAESHNISQDQLESARLSAVKASPIMQGVELALEQLNDESMSEFVPRLQTLVRRGVGLPTRAGCARTLVTLCVKRPDLVRPHAAALAKAVSGSLTESSAIQRQAWAAALGYMAPMVTANMLRNLLKHLQKVYFDKYESDVRGVAGLVLEQLAQKAPERLREHTSGPGSVSFVLFGSHDPQESIRECFRSAWQEYTFGSGGRFVEKHLRDLLELPVQEVAGDSWPRRIQGANAIADIAATLERNYRDTLTDAARASALGCVRTLLELCVPALLSAAQGRVWPGKEHVLGCLVKVCTASAPLLSQQAGSDGLQQVPSEVFAVLARDMARGETSYRRAVVTHYCMFIEKNPLDVYHEISAALLGLIAKSSESLDKKQSAAAMDVDDDDEELRQKPQRLALIASAIKALAMSLPHTRALGDSEVADAANLLAHVAETGVWNTRVASLEALASLFAHFTQAVYAETRSGALQAAGMQRVLRAVRACAAEGKYVAVRTAAFDALDAVHMAVEGAAGHEDVAGMCREILELLLLDPVPSIADRAKDTKPQWGA
ncbi:proteasome component M29, partial [Linderina pennispora]